MTNVNSKKIPTVCFYLSWLPLSSEEAALNMKNVELNAGFKHLKKFCFSIIMFAQRQSFVSTPILFEISRGKIVTWGSEQRRQNMYPQVIQPQPLSENND